MPHQRLPKSEWHALIKDAHPGYISWEEYERIEQRLQENAKSLGWERTHSPPREGSALLQGHAVCGLCGSRMHIHYSRRQGGQFAPNYVCFGRGQGFGDPACQSIVGTQIDAAVGQLLVETVTPMALDLALAVQQEITARVEETDFRGGVTTTLSLPRPLTAQQLRVTHEEVRQQIDTLLDEYTDAQTAHRLNQRGLHTGAGQAFDSASIQWVRYSHKIKSLQQRLLEAGWLTGKQIGAKLGVKRGTLGHWRKTGRIKARICNDGGEWLYWLADESVAADATVAHSSTDSSTARGAL